MTQHRCVVAVSADLVDIGPVELKAFLDRQVESYCEHESLTRTGDVTWEAVWDYVETHNQYGWAAVFEASDGGVA
jgi:hypothetical protein